MSNLQLDIYSDMIRSIKRGSYNGSPINAKPLFLLSIIDAIEKKIVENNQFPFSCEIEQLYKHNIELYNEKLTPLFKPFYYLQFDGLWHIEWATVPKKDALVSAKLIRENIKFARLDNCLWDLLQDEQDRTFLRNVVIDFFLK